jgi:hypothetical protein
MVPCTIWKHYLSWLVLKDLNKFALSTPDTADFDDVNGAGAEDEDGNVTDDGAIRREKSRGGGSGTKKAKAAKVLEEARKSNENHSSQLVEEIIKARKTSEMKVKGQKRTQDMISVKIGLKVFKDDPVMMENLRGKLKTLIDGVGEPTAADTSNAAADDANDDSDDGDLN